MTHVTMEYVLMAPVLILQVLFFPLAASWVMNIWIDSRRQIALQEVADHLGSVIQQIYFSLNRETISNGIVKYTPDTPKFIDNNVYTARARLENTSGADSSKILRLNVTLENLANSVETSIVLGPNVRWNEDSVYVSNAVNACIMANKSAVDETLRLWFTGGS